MFITAIFTIAKTWKQPKCPLADEWIKKMKPLKLYIYHIIIHKKNEIKPSAATWTQLQIFIVSEVNQETHV